MVIIVLCFSTISKSSKAVSVQASECFYNNITIFNRLTQLIFPWWTQFLIDSDILLQKVHTLFLEV